MAQTRTVEIEFNYGSVKTYFQGKQYLKTIEQANINSFYTDVCSFQNYRRKYKSKIIFNIYANVQAVILRFC